jgi:hypothetical protein
MQNGGESMPIRLLCLLGLVFLLALALTAPGQEAPRATSLRFEVTVAPGLLPGPTTGRLLVVMSPRKEPEPRAFLGETGLHVPPVLGVDVKGFAPGVLAVADQHCALYPLEYLARLPAGNYFVQAVFDYNPDLRLPDAPGNLYSEPVLCSLDPKKGGTVKLTLTKAEPEDKLPPEDDNVKFIKVRSEKLSKFHGRPMFLRAGVILPRGHARDRERTYPLRVLISGFGSRYIGVLGMMTPGTEFHSAWSDPETPPMIVLHLDGAGPLGDPYQVNSANNGPYGDAVVEELIPLVEKRFRGIGKPQARFLDGASTGGWVSLALQIFYPDFFNGTWSHCPDPVDFRAFELVDLYKDANAYVNRFGFERPAARELDGEVRYTIRNEVQREVVLGRGDRWTLSGKDWGSWNAVFGPRGSDGLPRAVWDGKTGAIDRTVLEHWQKYDLRMVLEKNWAVLAPKLRGKLRIWVGEADEYYLNNAVHLLDDFLQKAKPAGESRIRFASRMGHNWRGLTEKQMMQEMGAALGKR